MILHPHYMYIYNYPYAYKWLLDLPLFAWLSRRFPIHYAAVQVDIVLVDAVLR